MDFELKELKSTDVNLDTVTDIAIVEQSFTSGVVGCPDSYIMFAGDNIQVTVVDFSTKTGAQINTEVLTACETFVSNKYPSI